ncbi:hypothetical protein [Bacteroides salyersiae]|uniref:hypothetical protein n=1 Tax=Bacteroides salyersiae TaxID=291644 RepID=UPI00201DA1BC|nr:hypothetical protein [Bacteroides salyersiae]
MITQEGSTVQNYDVYNKEYIPDRRIRPTAILPECRISDPAEILEAGVVNRYLTDIIWYQGEMKPENIILDTDKDFKIDRSSNTNNRGRITVYKNVPFGAPLTLSFSATFVDMVGNNVRRRAYFNGFVYLTSSSFADAPLTFIPFCPRGDTFNPLSGMTCLPLCGDLKAGNELIPQAHWWYRKTASGLNLLGSEYEGYKSREIKIPTSEIGKDAHYVCRIKDCRHDLADLQETYLQEELDKISDYPRNLLAKQYFLDLNDEIKPGVVTEGEDADGKYICIPSPSVLYAYVGKTEQRDLFSGKMSFKENTVYILRVVGKHVSETESQWGFAFMIAYTDGTISYAKFGDNANKKREFVIKSTPNKTISHISSTYGFEIPSYIYGIQITEEYNYNLLEGDTEEVTINIEDNGTNSDNYKIAARNISKSLNAGNKVTVSIGDVVNLKGESTEYTVLIYQIKESGNQSVSSILSATKKTSILTIPSSFNSAYPYMLYLYAGKSGATAGNSVKYSNVQLLEGEYAWNVLGEDVEEVTIVGESINSYKSIEIKDPIQAGGKYTLDIGEIIKVEGSTEEYTVQMYQFGAVNSSIATPSGVITQNQKSITFTVNSKYNPELKVHLVLYAGVLNNTSGNTVQYKNIRLLQGETVLPSMPSYTPHFIPSAQDIEVESERITLPEGYRPDGEPTNYEEYDYTLTTAYPPEKWKICTPYGSSNEGLIDIPSDVQLFPAWAEIRTSEGVVEDPGKYYSMDWGNGKKGINILMDASELSTDLLTLNPVLYRGLDKVRYAASGINLPFNNIEDFVEGSRIVLEIPPNTPNKNAYISFRKDGFGLLIMYNVNGNVSLFIYGYNKRMSTIIKYVESVILRYELLIGATLEECQLFLNSGPYTGSFGNIENGGGNSFNIDVNSRVSLVEIYSPENVLLHKWDFEGDTDDERLSDKAETENKVNFSKSDGFEFIPV